jgi:hypothetical protein
MTCIVATTDGKTVWMGGDSLGASGYFCTLRKDKKVFVNGEYIIGFTTSFRMGDLLKWSFVPPKMPKNEKNIEKFMATKFITKVLKVFDKNGYGKNENNRKEGGEFLIGVRGKIFHVHGDYQMGLAAHDYDACGCGTELALGSLMTSKKLKVDKPEERLIMALEAAQMFGGGVREPWTILRV